MNILQHIIFPNFDIDAPEDLYVRVQQGVLISRANKNITFLQKGATAYFDTYFNSFTIQTWKNQTPIRQLKLRLFGEGQFVIKIKRHKLHTELKSFSEQTIELNQNGVDIDFADLNQHDEGMLFFELTALTENAQITGGFYHTDIAPVQDVKLGVVITHFNRKNYVLPAIERVSKGLLQDPYYKDKISLIVVDNSQNITPEEAQHAIVLPNQNLGGSGGFTRGLMYLEDDKTYTHCLFMDDDVSCEIESIRRTCSLLQNTNIENYAVAGAQFSDLFKGKTWEKGAIFDTHCHPLHHNLDMRQIDTLLYAEQGMFAPNYGGWWLFAFKISDVKKYPFPFFIRGDDILFSLQNKFNIATLNGINVWSENFGGKESPLIHYLMFRGTTVCNILTNPNFNTKEFIRFFSNWYFDRLYAHHYSSAEAILISVQDILLGSKIFTDDMGAENIRSKINSLPNDEQQHPIVREQYNVKYVENPSRSKIKRRHLIRKLTLNYLLIPKKLMKKGAVFQNKLFGTNFAQTYKFTQVYYENEAYKTGYVVEFNKSRLWKGYINYFEVYKQIQIHFEEVRREYIQKEKELTHRTFWEKVYENELKK